jgi:hypothetical protein
MTTSSILFLAILTTLGEVGEEWISFFGRTQDYRVSQQSLACVVACIYIYLLLYYKVARDDNIRMCIGG